MIDKNGLILIKVFKVHENYQHQYTLTLYNTKCKFLVNGKGTNIFIEKDLPNIHKIIKDVALNGNCINIKNLNQKLEEELTKLKITQEQIGVKLAIPDNTVENHNAKCFKCNRNVQSRALFCDKGQHWVHYWCLKLNSDEIRLLETQDRNEDYICKLCIEIIDTSQSKSRTIQKVAEASDTVTYKQLTSAQAMLDEELILICNTCGILINSLIVRCAICHQLNHEDCTIYDKQEHICPNCRIDTERPNEPTHVSILEELENDNETLLKCTHSCPDKITNTPGYQVWDIQNPDKQVTPEYTTENITSIVQDDLPKINSEKRTKEIRSNDLKLREQKLRKREELNIHEK